MTAAKGEVSVSRSGILALVGGGEWSEGCSFDRELLDASGADEVTVLPTAAAYEHPSRAVDTAVEWFKGLGASVNAVMAMGRPDAENPDYVATLRAARFIYIGGGSSLHLRSVLRDSSLWSAIVDAWHDGAVLAASSAGAMALCDPMVDPRGGAFTIGLGLINGMSVVAHHDTWPEERARRTLELAPRGLAIVGIDERTALLRDPDGTWRSAGSGSITISIDGQTANMSQLPG